MLEPWTYAYIGVYKFTNALRKRVLTKFRFDKAENELMRPFKYIGDFDELMNTRQISAIIGETQSRREPRMKV